MNGQITDQEIEQLRSVYENYLDKLLELSLISSDDHATFSQVYPLFDPFFVCYDKNVTEYEPLASISSRILNDRNHHYATYHRQAERLLGRIVAESEKTFLNMFYLMIEKSGGKIYNGLFVVEPGVMILTETLPVSPDSAISFLLSGISVETSLEFIAHHETKVARLTSSKTKAMNLPLFEINNYDKTQMKLVESALKSRIGLATDSSSIENVNLTLPAAKSTVAVFTVTLKDLDSILIGRLGNPRGNETAVIKVATKICQVLHHKYPEFIKPLEYYLNAKNQFKYTASSPTQVSPVQTNILPEAWGLFTALNIPTPPESAPPTSSFISMADFNARVTYMSFSKYPVSFSKSIAFVKNIVTGEGHASILSSYQVIHEGRTKRTKELYTELGWNTGLEPLLH